MSSVQIKDALDGSKRTTKRTLADHASVTGNLRSIRLVWDSGLVERFPNCRQIWQGRETQMIKGLLKVYPPAELVALIEFSLKHHKECYPPPEDIPIFRVFYRRHAVMANLKAEFERKTDRLCRDSEVEEKQVQEVEKGGINSAFLEKLPPKFKALTKKHIQETEEGEGYVSKR